MQEFFGAEDSQGSRVQCRDPNLEWRKEDQKIQIVVIRYSVVDFFTCLCPINRKLVAIRTVVSNTKYERGCKSGRIGFGRVQWLQEYNEYSFALFFVSFNVFVLICFYAIPFCPFQIITLFVVHFDCETDVGDLTCTKPAAGRSSVIAMQLDCSHHSQVQRILFKMLISLAYVYYF